MDTRNRQPTVSGRKPRPKVAPENRKRVAHACILCKKRRRKCEVAHDHPTCVGCRDVGSECVFGLAGNAKVVRRAGRDGKSTTIAATLASSVHQFYDHVANRFMRLFPEQKLSGRQVGVLHSLLAEVEKSSDGEEMSKTSRSIHPGQTSAGTQDHSGHGTIAEVFNALPNWNHAERLLDAFFVYAEANYYYFDEPLFRTRIAGLYLDGSGGSAIDIDFVALAMMAFALGSYFSKLHGVDPPLETLQDHGEAPGSAFFKGAQSLLPQVLNHCSLESLQCCLLMALYLLPTAGARASYVYLGFALRTALCLDLHRKVTSTPSTPSYEISVRVFWTVYIIERKIAISLGYPRALSLQDINCPLPVWRQDLDRKGSLRFQRLKASIDLVLLFDELIQIKKEIIDVEIFEDACLRLRRWNDALPLALLEVDGEHCRGNAHLQLHYHMIWIQVGRADLIHDLRDHLNSFSESPNSATEVGNDLVSASAGPQAVRSAYQIIDIINKLHDCGQLAMFSYTDFHSCCCATVIVILDSVLRPTLFASQKVNAAMDILANLASGSPNAKRGLQHIETLLTYVNHTLVSLANLPTQILTQSPSPKSDWYLENFNNERLDTKTLAQRFFGNINMLLSQCPSSDLEVLGLNGLRFASERLPQDQFLW